MTNVAFNIFLFICCVVTSNVEAAQRLSAEERVQFTLANRDDIPRSPEELLDLDPDHNLVLVETFLTVSGTTKTKYQETYKNLPIFGATVVLEKTKDGQFTPDAFGDFIKGTETDITESKFPSSQFQHANGLNEITKAHAFNIAMKSFGAEEESSVSLMSSEKIIYLDSNDRAYIAHEVVFEVLANGTTSVPAYVVDVYSGQVLDTWPMMHPFCGILVSTYGGTAKTGKYKYGANGKPSLAVANASQGNCILKNSDVIVYDFQKSRSRPPDAYSFVCSEGLNDEINGGYGPLADAFFFASKTWMMHRQWYNVEAYKQKPMEIGVHFGNSVDNAYFTGYRIVFGDGNYWFYPLAASSNVVAHEIGHGFTHANSKLIYRTQSGGMNEAFSDMAGETLEYYLNRQVDWLVGKEVSKKNVALRSMKDPPSIGSSIAHIRQYYDGLNVHYSSGIYNKAFYLLANSRNWGIKKAYHAMVLSNKLYWTRNSTFCSGFKGLLKASKDLGLDKSDVINAFKQVGITESCQ